MKQFLQYDEYSKSLIVALYDRAFVNIVSSLSSHQQEQGQQQQQQDDATTTTSSSIWIELLPQKINTSTTQIETKKDADDNIVSENIVSSSINPSEIQAVAILCKPQVQVNDSSMIIENNHVNNSNYGDKEYWCAVARYDKSLSLYCIDKSIVLSLQQETNNHNLSYYQIYPTTIHYSIKRAGNLCFATIMPPVEAAGEEELFSDDSERIIQPNLHVVIAGDLAGDAVAFSLRTENTIIVNDENINSKVEIPTNVNGDNKQQENDEVDDDEEASNLDEHKVASKYQRILLGHTASMLTSVQVVNILPNNSERVQNQQQQQYIVTSDRDEKIRISYFPDTYKIHGYLLGHTSFIADCQTSVRYINNNKTALVLCVSISGDGTIRLWDCLKCQQLAIGYYNEQTVECVNETEKVDNNNNNLQSSTISLVPARLVFNNDGTTIVCIYEDCCQIDVWEVIAPEEENTFSLHRTVQHSMPSQPLAVKFVNYNTVAILLCDPIYMQVLQIEKSINNTIVKDVTRLVDITKDYTFCNSLRNIGVSNNIIMPCTLLERDSRTQKIKLQKIADSRNRHGRSNKNATTSTNNIQNTVSTSTTAIQVVDKDYVQQHGIVEQQQEGNVVVVQEEEENNVVPEWNNSNRRAIARERTRRMKKRQREKINNSIQSSSLS